jgi:hypothetical protein
VRSGRPDRIVEIAVGPLVGIDVFAAVGRRQSRAFLGDQKSRVTVFAFDVKSHHVHELIVDTVWLVIRDRGQRPTFTECMQPGIEQIALLDGSDDRGVGALVFHRRAS